MQTRDIKIRATAAFVKRIDAERSPPVLQRSCLRLSETVPTAEQSGNPGPRAGTPSPGRAETSESLKTLPPNCRDDPLEERACAQARFRLFCIFFRSSAAGLRLRVRGVISTSVACVMTPASDVPRGLS